RYSTTGSSRICNAQPIHVHGPGGELALGHNGNLVNAEQIRQEMEAQGHAFVTGTDSEVIAQMLVASPAGTLEERLRDVMRRISGAYSLVILTPTALIAARDPMGNRPLCIGRIADGWVVASETCALDNLRAEYLREVAPGEIVVVDRTGLRCGPMRSRRG